MSQSSRFLRLGCPPGLLFVLLLPFHLLPALAVGLGAAVGYEDPVAALILGGLSTGTFIYVGAFEIVAEEFAGCHSHGSGEEDCCSGPCLGSEASACIDAPVISDVDEKNKAKSAAGELASEWAPNRVLKFAIFVLGCGVLAAITAALPSHEDLHAH